MNAQRSHLVTEVVRVSRERPLERKLLVGQSLAQGRELLRAAALTGVGWVGWEPTTPAKLALDLVLPELVRAGERRGDEFDLMAAADAAVDAVTEREEAGPFSRGAGGISGYREAIRSTLLSFRAGGVTPAQLRRAGATDAKLLALAAMLGELERGLRDARLVDHPEVMRRAGLLLREQRGQLPEGRLFLLPGHSLRGVAGALIGELLRSDRAELLAADPVLGLEAPRAITWPAAEAPAGALSPLHAPSGAATPGIEVFAAATPHDEVREVLRRIVSAGIPWDQVEIVATDPSTYGAALDALARRLCIPVTYARGLDSRRTRAGRAVEAYLNWIAEDFNADILRQTLETGDLSPTPPFAEKVSAAALARRLRRLRVGWGRERYLTAIDQAIAIAAEPAVPGEDQDPEEAELTRARERMELAALRALLRELLEGIPRPASVPVTPYLPLQPWEQRISPAGIAAGVLAFLQRVPAGRSPAEATMRKVLEERLERIRQTLLRETGWEAAIGIVRGQLVTRIAPSGAKGLAPWTSTGGHLYLSDLSTAGFALRPHRFVVGLDAARVTGSGGSDPLLTDADRVAIAGISPDPFAPLATSAERVEEARHALAAALARLRGTLTLSYSAWESTEGQSVSPSPELLQALRLREGDPALTYEHLRATIGSLAAAVPAGELRLDGDDVWLGAIADGRMLREGTHLVEQAFPGLAGGLRARLARQGEQATAYDGILTPHPELDPRASREIFSASRLERLGSCPRRYFYQHVLRVSIPDDPVLDADVWLDPRQRGSLLHAVYERALSLARERGIDYRDELFPALALECLEAEADHELRHSPPPSRAVHDQERADLRAEVLTWVAMIRADRPDWLAVELRFGRGASEVSIPAGGGTIRIQGAIDRVDRLPEGGLRIVDYKTGSPRPYRDRQPFSGGRRIQHLLYTLAAEQLLDTDVATMEYHFPTRKGEMRRVAYGSVALARGARVLDALLEIAASGHFVTTDDCDDCRFCDFARVCRIRDEGYGKRSGERVDRALAGIERGLPEYVRLAELRGIDD